MSALQYNSALRNAQLDAITDLLGAGARLEIRTGQPPAKCSAADVGTLLVSIALPRRPLSRSFDGVTGRLGLWSAFATADGDAGHFRLKDRNGICVIQGSITAEGKGGALEFDDTWIPSGALIEVAEFVIVAGNQ